MPTKNQSKTAVNNAATQINADIDALPGGVNIRDGLITFNPTRWQITLDNGAQDISVAQTLAATIVSNLTLAGRSSSTTYSRRGGDGERAIIISTALADYKIVNFTVPPGS